MFLLENLQRPDVLPADDFGVRQGYRRLKGLEAAPGGAVAPDRPGLAAVSQRRRLVFCGGCRRSEQVKWRPCLFALIRSLHVYTSDLRVSRHHRQVRASAGGIREILLDAQRQDARDVT